MSATGVQLFDDDLAADIRELFREQLKRGETGHAATAILVDEFREVVGTEEESVFWLALAYVQWEHGALQDEILGKALEVIDNGSDLQRWAFDAKLQRKRATVLERLRNQLQSPPTKPKTVCPRKRLPSKCEWHPGDLFSYKLDSGQHLLLRVINIPVFGGEEHPICELLDWVGTAIPEADAVRALPIRRNKRYPSESMFGFPMLKKHLCRCRILGVRTPTVLRDDGSYKLPIDFNRLAEELEEYFGLFIDNRRPLSR